MSNMLFRGYAILIAYVCIYTYVCMLESFLSFISAETEPTKSKVASLSLLKNNVTVVTVMIYIHTSRDVALN